MFLELKNIDIGYRNPLIKEITTSLDLGESCLLIGNNGVGKTTLIKSILNQIPVLKGEIALGGKNIRTFSKKEVAEQIAVVFSKSPVPVNFSLLDLVSLGKFIHYPYYFRLSNSDKLHIESIIDDLNLSQYRNFPLTQLSDGNLQKAFVGRALAQNSPVIILDEPTTHLDEENKIMILKLIRNLAQNHKKLILFSSHDWRLSKEFADKMWFIHGQKMDSGITEEVLLKNDVLLNPNLFQFESDFEPPQIFAPDLHKEMLYSFLQKNIHKNLSAYTFAFKSSFWEISGENFQQNAPPSKKSPDASKGATDSQLHYHLWNSRRYLLCSSYYLSR